uniref:three-helix bundle dimerization domain-containing protein n=1 Tax=Actinomadura spongiicola TaxID=2303421 RepID=UPI001314D777|nr:luciferase family protein [Actinomadura spongiicola]
MGGTGGLQICLADRVTEQLSGWPSLKLCRAACGLGQAFACGGDQIVHLHGPDQAELHLTWPLVQRMRAPLDDCAAVRLRPGSGWIELWLGGNDDVGLLISLVSVAIKANLAARDSAQPRLGPCSLGYSYVPAAFMPHPPPGRGGLAMTPSGNPVEREEHIMREVIDRLIRSLAGRRPPEQVSQAVNAVYHRFDETPLRDYVPVLVERFAREKLITEPPG